MEARYTPGDGMLVARADRWLLLGLDDRAAAAPVLDQLWHDLDQPAGCSIGLATVRRHLSGASCAWLDATTGDHGSDGGGQVTVTGDRWELTLGQHAPAASLRLVEGVVAAAAFRVTGRLPFPGEVRTPAGPVIDGIPPEILGAPRPSAPAAYDAVPGVDPDHDHHTRRRRPAPTPVTSQLEQATSDTVLAVRCEQGHLTDPLLTTCRTCARAIPPQEPARVARPPLGVLRLPDGEPVLLDRPVVLGRRPACAGPDDWPHLVQLPHDSTYLSRLHVRIDLDGWHVVAQDLGSRGGTTLLAPGRDPQKIRGHEPHLLEHGTILDLAGAYRVSYHSTLEETS